VGIIGKPLEVGESSSTLGEGRLGLLDIRFVVACQVVVYPRLGDAGAARETVSVPLLNGPVFLRPWRFDDEGGGRKVSWLPKPRHDSDVVPSLMGTLPFFVVMVGSAVIVGMDSMGGWWGLRWCGWSGMR